jgi:hypothetical protein
VPLAVIKLSVMYPMVTYSSAGALIMKQIQLKINIPYPPISRFTKWSTKARMSILHYHLHTVFGRIAIIINSL